MSWKHDNTPAESIHLWVTKQLRSARRARRYVDGSHEREVMLSAKMKAYTDVLCFIEDRFKVARVREE